MLLGASSPTVLSAGCQLAVHLDLGHRPGLECLHLECLHLEPGPGPARASREPGGEGGHAARRGERGWKTPQVKLYGLHSLSRVDYTSVKKSSTGKQMKLSDKIK